MKSNENNYNAFSRINFLQIMEIVLEWILTLLQHYLSYWIANYKIVSKIHQNPSDKVWSIASFQRFKHFLTLSMNDFLSLTLYQKETLKFINRMIYFLQGLLYYISLFLLYVKVHVHRFMCIIRRIFNAIFYDF